MGMSVVPDDDLPSFRPSGGMTEVPVDDLITAAPEDTSLMSDIGQGVKDVLAGGVRGAGSIGATLIRPFESAEENESRRADMDAALQSLVGADPKSMAYGAGKLGAEIAGTAGAGGVLARGAGLIPGLGRFAPALESWGMAAPTSTGRVAGAAERLLAGGATGAASSAMIDPNLEQAGIGAGVGATAAAVLPPAMREVRRFAGGLHDLIRGDLSAIRAGRFLNKAAATGGQDADAFAARIAAAPDNLTAAQAGFNEGGSDVWMALGKLAEKGDAEAYRMLREAQEAGMSGTMSRMARGGTTEQSTAATKAFMQQAEQELGPRRTVFLSQLAFGGDEAAKLLPQLSALERQYVQALQNQGRMATEAGAAISSTTARGGLVPNTQQTALQGERIPSMVQGAGAQPKPINEPGFQNFQNAASEFGGIAQQLRAEADALRQQLSTLPAPFTALPVREAVASMAASTVNAAEETVMNAVMKALSRAGDDPVKIAEVRKLGVNQLVGDLLQNGSISKIDAAAALTKVKKVIDQQLGDDMVNKYFKPYAAKLAYRDSLRAMDELRRMQTESPKMFMQTIRGDNPAFMEKYGIESMTKFLGQRRMGKLEGVAGQMQRDVTIGERASGAEQQLADLYQQHFRKVKLPPWFTRETTTANTALDYMYKHLDSKTQKIISEAMKSGPKAAALMRKRGSLEAGPLKDWLDAGGVEWLARTAPAGVEAGYE